MREWGVAQTHPSVDLARLNFFSTKKQHSGGEVEFVITVREFVTPKEPTTHSSPKPTG